MIRLVVCFLMITNLIGCSDKYEIDERVLKLLLSEKNKEISNKRCVYIIYSDKSCGACVKLTRNFVLENIGNTESFVCIITNVNEKEAFINFGSQVISQTNFIIDQKGIGSAVVPLFPKAYIVEHQSIIKSFEINYNNATHVFDELRNYMTVIN